MVKLSISDRDIWIGWLSDLGFLIYDPKAQPGRKDGFVRLFKVSENKTGIFDKENMRSKLRKAKKDLPESFTESAEKYERAITRMARYTHCYSCKRDVDSIDFKICRLCDWIVCKCGSCGCGFRG